VLDPYTREEEPAKAQRQAVIGAAVGGAVGLMTGDDSMERKKRALIGAGLGALAGASVGTYMDRQEAKLRAELERTGVSVTRDGDNITLNMPGNITFATNSSDLNASFFDVLNSVGLVVNEFDQTVIEVAGHTDSTGTDEYNQQLSQRRASAVASYLGTRSVRSDRIIPVGSGETHPVASNDTDVGRQQNRRVELTLVPLTLS
jgi:outer membrane protein OmpA-like peptidoglycan-associated protein